VNLRYIKMLLLLLSLVFATQGCAVFIGTDDYHHRHYYHHWHGSSPQQSPQVMAQLDNQKGEDSERQVQVAH
jgi:hypothetical protein